ncbi:MAG: Hsp33 family molecular chaperone HslO [Alicyclobacillaceae bacterium]|nr:Hsp33 family molecular chaperone HslO [Alicyclobacillaceae bacterium]
MAASADDYAIRTMALDGRARAFACITTGLVSELQRRHGLWPVATAALGRTASIAAMMGMMLKEQERLTVRVRGDGPLGAITVDTDSNGHVRGYVENPHVHLPATPTGKLDVGRAVGRGMLYVIRDMGLRDYYQGSCALQTGEIADDFTYYFAVSEQVPSAVGAGVLVDVDNKVLTAGGFLIQLLPGHVPEDADELERRLAKVGSVTKLLQEGVTPAGLLEQLVPGPTVLETRRLSFRCTCSRERLSGILRQLGAAEIEAMLREQGGAEVVCHFCSTVYRFTAEELQELLNGAGGGDHADSG